MHHRPGHSPSDTVFHDEASGELIAGDHLIKHISSNPLISRPLAGGDPTAIAPKALVAYLASLRATRDMELSVVLPGHGEPVEDHRALIDERFVMHERRADKLHGLVTERPRTAHELAQELWGNVAVTQAYLTLSEILGHVDLLLDDGRVVQEEADGVVHFVARLTQAGQPGWRGSVFRYSVVPGRARNVALSSTGIEPSLRARCTWPPSSTNASPAFTVLRGQPCPVGVVHGQRALGSRRPAPVRDGCASRTCRRDRRVIAVTSDVVRTVRRDLDPGALAWTLEPIVAVRQRGEVDARRGRGGLRRSRASMAVAAAARPPSADDRATVEQDGEPSHDGTTRAPALHVLAW